MRLSSRCVAVLALLFASACAAVPSDDEEAADETEDALSSTGLGAFSADLKAAEMAGAAPLVSGSLGASTLFRYSAGAAHHLQLAGGANASRGSISWFLYDAQGHLIDNWTLARFANNSRFFLQPYIAHAGSYFLRIATADKQLLPLDLRSIGRVTTQVSPLALPVPTCEAVASSADLERLVKEQPVATVADVAAVGLPTQRIAGGERWVKLGAYRIQRFERDERDESDGCSVFGDGCGEWAEAASAELPEALATGALFLVRQASTRSEILYVGSRLQVGGADLRLKGTMGVPYTEQTSVPPTVAALGPLGFLTPRGRGPQEAAPFTVTDAADYRPQPRAIGSWDGIFGKNCARLYTTSTSRTAGGALRRTVMTLGATFGDVPPPLTGPLVINEIMPAGASATDEFVELYNPGSTPIALEGHVLSSVTNGGGRTPCFTGRPGDVIAPRSYFVLGGSGFGGARGADLSCNLGSSGRLLLADAYGRKRDGVGWGATAEGSEPTEGYYRARAPSKAKSMSRRSDGRDSDVNATDFGVSSPTPGAPNPVLK